MISYSTLSDLYNALDTGRYHPNDWVEIANLTLKIYELLEKEPTELNAMYAGACMSSLITIASNLELIPIGLSEILSVKLSHILGEFGYLFSDEQYRLFYDMWQTEQRFAKQNLKNIKENDIGQSVPVLRRVIHDDWHKDFFEIIFPDVKDIPMDGNIPPRKAVQVQQAMPEALNLPQHGPKPMSGSHNLPPRGPKPQTQTVPPHNNSDQIDSGGKGEHVDILDLVLIALIRSTMQGIKSIDGGVQMFIKPDVLKRTFDTYEFAYGLTKYLNFWAERDFITLGGKGMPGILYVCQILARFGCAPQIGANDTIIVRGANAKKLQDINDYQYLYKMWLLMTDSEKEALSCINYTLSDDMETSYTAYKAYSYWQAIGDYPKFAVNIMNNSKNL